MYQGTGHHPAAADAHGIRLEVVKLPDAKHLTGRLEIHHTPNHGRWLIMA